MIESVSSFLWKIRSVWIERMMTRQKKKIRPCDFLVRVGLELLEEVVVALIFGVAARFQFQQPFHHMLEAAILPTVIPCDRFPSEHLFHEVLRLVGVMAVPPCQ